MTALLKLVGCWLSCHVPLWYLMLLIAALAFGCVQMGGCLHG